MKRIRSAFRLWFLAAPLLLLAVLHPANAQDRIALVIGNGTYLNAAYLPEAVTATGEIARLLGNAGFDVTVATNAPLDAMIRTIAEFGQKLRRAGAGATGLVYYTGYGVQALGANYLLPTDVDIRDAADLDLVAVPVSSIFRQLVLARNQTNIVILDASHGNPFAAVPGMAADGLAAMRPPSGTFLAFAATPDSRSPRDQAGVPVFATALTDWILEPGMPIEQSFQNVQRAVLAATGGQQSPWFVSTLEDPFFFVPKGADPSEDPAEQAMWGAIQISRDPVQIVRFIQIFPDSRHGAAARAILSDALANPNGLRTGSPGQETPLQSLPKQAGEPSNVKDLANPGGAPGEDREVSMFQAAIESDQANDYSAYLQEFPNGTFAELAQIALQARTAPDTTGSNGLNGLSLTEFTMRPPMFAPIEGLPPELWQGAPCSTCHHWTREALCTQGGRYAGIDIPQDSQDHPFGGVFQAKLKVWAEAGCQ